ncbi:MAG: hypothetical protein GY811_00455 [Myxococcales bacterium]|nr:hypothetical protein [Myxococcales bacterium]
MSHTVFTSRLLPRLLLTVTLCGGSLAACGGDDDGDGSDAGPGPDAGAEGPCGFEDRYLPYQEGYQWTYRVTDLGSPATTSKTQALATADDPDLGAVIVQTTTKATGTTVSALKRVADSVVRLRQEDRDELGTLERTTVYDPGQNRLDEVAEHLVLGAEWDDVYTVTVTDETGAPVSSGERTDHWEVLGVDVECSSPLGDFTCLHLRRQRTAGGVSDKQFFFAKGIGKVKEINANQVEELIGCE